MKNYVRISLAPETAKQTGLKKDVFFFFDDTDSWQLKQLDEFLISEIDLKADLGCQVFFAVECSVIVPTKDTSRHIRVKKLAK